MRTKTIKQETSIVRRLGRDRLVWLAAILVPAVLYFPIAFSDGGWGADSAAFWWLCWVLLCIVCDNAKRIQHLCTESLHLQNLVGRVLRTRAIISLAVTASLCIGIAVFVHIPVPRRIVGIPIPLFLMIFGIFQERLLIRLREKHLKLKNHKRTAND